ncbi:MAG: uroporphyrinogen decarboxylase family protein [Pirellulaceae bacterium]
MSMTPRERVLTALDRQRPDRAPLDYWAEPCVTERLLRDLELPDRDALLDRLAVDVRALSAVEPPLRELPDGMRENFWGERWQKVRVLGTDEWFHVTGALAEAETIEDLERYDWPTPDLFDYSPLKEQVRKYQGFALRYGFGDNFERPSLVRGKEQFYCDLALRPDMAHFLIDKFTEFYCEDLTRALEATDGQIDMVLLLADLGTQQGLMFSKEMLNTFFAPYAAKLFAIARQAGVKSMLHSCGSVRAYIPELIDAGVDILNPIQVRAQGMVPSELKREFGNRLCFHGGVDIQRTLPRGTPEEVRTEVRTRIREMGSDGGYIVCSTHNLQNDASTENILAMYDVAARSY